MNSIITKVIKLVLFAIPAVAMVVASDMYFPFITGKSFAFRLAVELVFCLYIGLAWADEAYRPRWNSIMKSFAVFTLVVLVADIFAVDSTRAIFSNFERMEGFVLIAHLFAYYIVLVSILREKRDWTIMLFSTVGISVFMMLFGLLQLFGGAVINQGGLRLDGTLGNSAYMATYMVFHIFFLLYLWVTNGNKIKGIGDSVLGGTLIYIVYYLLSLMMGDLSFGKPGGVLLALGLLLCVKICWVRFSSVFKRFEKVMSFGLYGFVCVLQVVILYYTATRGATLGFIGGIVIASLYILYSNREDKRVRTIALIILGLIVVSVSLFVVFRKSDVIQKSPVLNRFANISLNDSTQARAIIWPMAFEAFKEHPVFGWGQDNFIFAFAKYYRPEMIRHEAWFDRTHNVFLDWLIAGGALGFVSYLLLYLFAIRQLVRSVVFDKKEKAILGGLLFAYAFLNLFIFDNLVSYCLFVLLLGLASSSFVTDVKRKSINNMEFSAFAMLCCLAFAAMFILNYGAYKQNITLTKALSPQKEGYNKNIELVENAVNAGPTGRFESLEQMDSIVRSILSSKNISNEDKNRVAMLLIKDFEKYNQENPDELRGRYILGVFLVDVGLYDDGISLLEEVISMSPKKQQTYYALAKAYFFKAGQNSDEKLIEQGLMYLKSAYEFAPQMDGPRNIYLNTLLSLNKLDVVDEVLKKTTNPKETIDPAIVDILVKKGLLK